MVLKTGPDRPVQPEKPKTGYLTDPSNLKNRLAKNRWKNRSNRRLTGKPEEPSGFLTVQWFGNSEAKRRRFGFKKKTKKQKKTKLAYALTLTNLTLINQPPTKPSKLPASSPFFPPHPPRPPLPPPTKLQIPASLLVRDPASLLVRHPAAATTTALSPPPRRRTSKSSPSPPLIRRWNIHKVTHSHKIMLLKILKLVHLLNVEHYGFVIMYVLFFV
ncbi:uncharacterized protein LOC110267818 [Arachis ipaensis]|uniref:uncharacterized protein LOC110267818 n=1 Tax=Arachis ipaensis TaxID=130454 RepID=UPI000A2B0759|nr:uncharacterized protein LOC110267818 [Arachis ipaensis]